MSLLRLERTVTEQYKVLSLVLVEGYLVRQLIYRAPGPSRLVHPENPSVLPVLLSKQILECRSHDLTILYDGSVSYTHLTLPTTPYV